MVTPKFLSTACGGQPSPVTKALGGKVHMLAGEGNEVTVASPDQIAQALARKFNWNISPSGDTALDMLDLDTHIPAVQSFVSDRPYRQYKYGPSTFSFSHTANKEISALSPITSLVIQALKARGKQTLSEADLRLIASRLNENQIKQLAEESKNHHRLDKGSAQAPTLIKGNLTV